MSHAPRDFRAEASGARLDSFVAEQAGISRALAARLIADGIVTVDGARAAKSQRVEEGMLVSVGPFETEARAPEPEDIAIPIVYEDDHLLVVSKPAGLVVHPAPGHQSGTLVNALLARAGATPQGGSAERPGIARTSRSSRAFRPPRPPRSTRPSDGRRGIARRWPSSPAGGRRSRR